MTTFILLEKLRSAIAKSMADAGNIVLGVSGGCDSMTLLHAVALLMPDDASRITVAHANHGLRGVESDDDERLVVAVCETLGIPCVAERCDVAEHNGGIEASAREARYAMFSRVADSVGANVVMTAHTMDDQAETLLMHLGRGAGLDGMTGIPPSRHLSPGVMLVRPLLHVPRRMVRDAALEWNVRWREDSSNDDLRFTRNQIRHSVLPAIREIFGADATERIARVADHLANARAIVSNVVEEALAHVLSRRGEHFVLDAERLMQYGIALRVEIIRYVLRLTLQGVPADAATVARVMSLLDARVSSRASIRGTLSALRDHQSIVIGHEFLDEPHNVQITTAGTYVAGAWLMEVVIIESLDRAIHSDPSTAIIDNDAVRGAMRWRTWIDGDRFRPLGMEGSVLVSDILTDAKIPHSSRRNVMVLCDDIGIVWVCGHRIADRVKIRSTSTSILVATLTAG